MTQSAIETACPREKVAVLGHSRRIFVRALLSERQEDWRQGVAAAFDHFDGSTRTLLIVNPLAMVLTPRVGEKFSASHPAFAGFCRDWGASARACAP